MDNANPGGTPTSGDNRLALAYQHMVAKQPFQNDNWFLKGGMKKVFVEPDQQGGGKWFCTEMVRRGFMTKRQFLRFAWAHAWGIFRQGEFCLWYFKHAGKLIDRLRADEKTNWEQMKILFVDRPEREFQLFGWDRAFIRYYEAVHMVWAAKGLDIPSPTRGFHLVPTFKLMTTRWFWKSALKLAGGI